MPSIMITQHSRMEAIEKTCKDSKKTYQDSQEVNVQTNQSNKKIQTWMGSSKRLAHVLQLDIQNGYNKWKDAIDFGN